MNFTSADRRRSLRLATESTRFAHSSGDKEEFFSKKSFSQVYFWLGGRLLKDTGGSGRCFCIKGSNHMPIFGFVGHAEVSEMLHTKFWSGLRDSYE